MTLPGLSERDYAAMSWHQRERYRKSLLARLEAERPAPRPPEPVIVGPYSRVDAPLHTAADPALSVALSVVIHSLVVGLRKAPA